MPGETSVNKIPFPLDADAPDGPTQIKALADLLDTLKWGSRNLKPVAGVKAAGGNLALTTSYQDVPETTLEITPAVASILKVIAIFNFQSIVSTEEALGTVRVDAVDQSQPALAEGSGTFAQVYAIPLTAAAHTIKLRAKVGAEGHTGECNGFGTQFLYELIAS